MDLEKDEIVWLQCAEKQITNLTEYLGWREIHVHEKPLEMKDVWERRVLGILERWNTKKL